MKLKINLKNENQEYPEAIILPASEEKIAGICERLDILNNINGRVEVVNVTNSDRFDLLLKGTEQNLDELNYLARRLDTLTLNEVDIVVAVAMSVNISTAKDLINLTYNTHCYNLITDFSDLNHLGKQMRLNELGAMSKSEFEDFNGKAYIEEMLAKNNHPLISSLGFVYPNSNIPTEPYQGRRFPAFWYEPTIITLALCHEEQYEYLYLPCNENELHKAELRLGADEYQVLIHDDEIPKNIYNIILLAGEDFENLNHFSKLLMEVGTSNLGYLSKLVEYSNISNPDEFEVLMKTWQEFELFPNIHNAEDYGKYMICDSGHYEYDENLEEFIDFQAYGENRIANEVGVFASQGYLTYLGYNIEMADILNNTLGTNIVIDEHNETLKLYMPLQISTFYEEDYYGNYQQLNFPDVLPNDDFVGLEDELDEFLQGYQEHCDSDRQLMEYYDERDSLNAKVHNLHFEIERVNREIYWVCRTHDNFTTECNSIRITEDNIYKAFIRMYNKLKANEDTILNPLIRNLEKLREQRSSDSILIKNINKEIAETAEQNHVMTGLMSKGILDSALFLAQSNEYKAKIQKLKAQKLRLLQSMKKDMLLNQIEEIVERSKKW